MVWTCNPIGRPLSKGDLVSPPSSPRSQSSDKVNGASCPATMSKAKKARAPLRGKTIKLSPTPEQIARHAWLRRVTRHMTALCLCIIAAGVGLYELKRHVERDIVFLNEPPQVIFKDRPVWMSDFLCEQLLATVRPMGAHSAFDRDLLVDVATSLRSNPWIKNVRQVRRAYAIRPGDTIEIEVEGVGVLRNRIANKK